MATDSVANAQIGFDSDSLAATINEGSFIHYIAPISCYYYYVNSPIAESTESNNVVLTVVRRGELGTVMVYWTAGLPGSSIANGSLTPDQGSFQMTPTDTSYQILLTVSLPILTVMHCLCALWK